MDKITRRDALGLGLAALLPAFGGCGYAEGQPAAPASSTAPGLARRAALKGLVYGAACEADHLDRDPDHAAAFLRECRLLVSQNELKWGFVQPVQGKFDFSRSDRLLAFAEANGIPLRGHTFVWHYSNPDWLEPALRGGKPRKILEEHIWSVAGRYRGKIQSWDVVNEAIEDYENGRDDQLRETIWLAALGPSYIETAFRIAHEADPHAVLSYNDYGLDYGDDGTARKRDKVLALLENLVRAKAPIHAFGIQAHLRAGKHFDAVSMTRFLDDVARLGLEIYVSELDVTDLDLPRRIRIRDARVAAAAHEYLTAVLAHPAVKLVATWGLSDKYTYLNEPGFKHWLWTARPLPLDAQMNRKPLWQSMAQAFDAAPTRPPLAL